MGGVVRGGRCGDVGRSRGNAFDLDPDAPAPGRRAAATCGGGHPSGPETLAGRRWAGGGVGALVEGRGFCGGERRRSTSPAPARAAAAAR